MNHRQYTGGRKSLTKPYTLDRLSPPTLGFTNLVLAGDLLQGCGGCEQNAAPAVAVKSSGAKNCPTLHQGRSKSLHNLMATQRVRLWFLPTPLTPNTVKAKLRTTAAESLTCDCFQPDFPDLRQVLHACRHPLCPLIYSVSPQFAADKRGGNRNIRAISF